MPVIKNSTPILSPADVATGGYVVRAYRADTGLLLGATTAGGGGDTGTLVCHMPCNGVPGIASVVDATGAAWTFAGTASIAQDHGGWAGSNLETLGASWVQTNSAAGWAFGTADFNIQFRCRANALPSGLFYAALGNWSSNAGFCVFLRPDGTIQFQVNADACVSAPGVFAAKTDYWVDVRRVSGVVEVRLNGIVVASGALPGAITRNDFMRFGANGVSTDVWVGRLGHLRAVSGGLLANPAPLHPPSRPTLGVGLYELWTPYSGETYVVCADSGVDGVRNHQILRTTPV